MTDNTQKFHQKAESYDAGRPAYSEELIDCILRECGVRAGDRVADIGAGTGIFTQQLLRRGLSVTAVEPNADMRAALVRRCDGFSAFSYTDGNAACTGLEGGSVTLVTAAQAFHWFPLEEFRAECSRIAGEGAYAAIVYNDRKECEFNERLNQICARRCPNFNERVSDNGEARARFFRGTYQTFRFPNRVFCDRETLIHTFLSRSYAPRKGETGYEEMTREIGALFDVFQRNGTAVMEYESLAYVGKIGKEEHL